jgi:hypothetical protein
MMKKPKLSRIKKETEVIAAGRVYFDAIVAVENVGKKSLLYDVLNFENSKC